MTNRGIVRGTTVRRSTGWAVAVVVALIAAVGVVFVPATPAEAMSQSDTMFTLANRSRVSAGLAPLERNPQMDAIAQSWARKMMADQALSHRPDLAAGMPAGWRSIGENVAQGNRYASELHANWMASPGHKANILGRYTDIGVGYVKGANGRTWGVQIFALYP